jgi:flagellar hook-associated protein 3 FlgL
LRAALEAGDNAEINRLIPKIEQAADKVSSLRGDVGSRQQLLDNIVNHIDDSAVELKKTLGGLIDTDTAEAITKVYAQQQALEAALQVASRSMNLSVLQFLQ